MPTAKLSTRVHQLEDLMSALIHTVDRAERNLNQLSAEMREFKTEMRLSRERSEREMQEFKEEMHDFKEEMRLSRERSEREMQEFKEEMRLAREASDRKMEAFHRDLREGERKMRQANERYMRKMGTLVEDMVAPSIPTILHQEFGCPRDGLDCLAIRMKRRHPVTRRNGEFDLVAAWDGYLAINETKSTLGANDVTTFVEDVLPGVREFFPEYAERAVIGIIASFSVDESVLRCAERQGLLVLGFGDNVMEVLNTSEFVPRHF